MKHIILFFSQQMIICISIFLIVNQVPFAASFSTPSPPWKDFLSTLTNTFNPPQNSKTINDNEVVQLKSQLLTLCQTNIGKCTPQIRQELSSVITELTPYNPTANSATSPLLKRVWVLEWTSEKEINFFLERGISERITQTLSGDGEGGEGVLENYIPFVKGGGFGVTGRIAPAATTQGEDGAEGEDGEDGVGSSIRTNFKFLNAKLDLGRWGAYNFPPVGEGWFDTVYLDEELRIDTNSRDDILICTAEQ